MQGQITPEMARAELARRQAARAELERRRSQQAQPENSGNGVSNFLESVSRGGLQAFINPVVGAARAGDKALMASANSSNSNPLKVLSQLAIGSGNYLSDKLGLPNVGDLNPIDLIENAPNKTAAKVSEFVSSFGLPFLKPLQAMGAAGKVAKIGDLAGTGAAYAASDTLGRGDDANLGTNTFLGAVLPVGANAALKLPLAAARGVAKGIVSGVEKASRRTGSEVKTPEQLAEILPDLAGVPVPLQEVTNAGYLRNIANESGSVPFSGVINPAQRAVNHTDEMAKAVYNSIGGHIAPEEANPIIHKAINSAEERVSTANSKLYQDLAKSAKEAGVVGSIKNIQKEAADILQNYNQAAIKEAHPLHEETFLRGLLGSLEKGFLPNMEKEYMIGEDAPVADLMDMVNVQQGIGRYLGRIRNKEGKEAATAVAKNLYGLAEKDMDEVIKASKNENLMDLLKNAKEDYKKNVLPYRETDIKKRLTETETAEIANTLMNPRNKGVSILGHLNPVERNIVLSQALKPAVEATVENAEFNTTPYKLLSKFKDLKKKNPTAFNELVSPDIQKSFESLENLYEATKNLRPIARKPQTGIQVKPILYGAGLAGLTSSLGSAAGLSNPMSLLAGAAMTMGNREFQKLLRDPKLLEAYAAGKGGARENALNAIFSGKKSNAIRKTAGALSNPAVLADLVTSRRGEEE